MTCSNLQRLHHGFHSNWMNCKQTKLLMSFPCSINLHALYLPVDKISTLYKFVTTVGNNFSLFKALFCLVNIPHL